MDDIKKKILISLFIVFMIFPIYVYAAKAVATKPVLSDEAQMCLGCHSNKDMSRALENKEILSLYVNSDTFVNSIHNAISCAGCHMDISMENHPQVKKIKSKKEYTANASKTCSMCHTDDQLRKNPVHSALISNAACVQCHGFHSIKGVAAQKAGLGQTQYCLSCHKSQISMPLKNGESLSVFVDESSLRNSAHGKLECTKCHSNFSKTQHPVRTFNSIQDYFIGGMELCKKCHSETYIKYQDSIHYTMLKSGNPKAPTCTSCHGVAHATTRTKTDKTLGLTSCNKCHEDMKASYEASIHYKERIKGNEKAPICSSCHNAHNIESTKMTTKIKEGCFKCHKDMEKVHSRWLKNPPITLSSFAGAHFDVVSCAACHSPDAKRGIYLSLYDRKTGNPLPEEELLKLLETDSNGLMGKIDTNGDGSIDAKELWNLFQQLYKKGITTIFLGKMDVSTAAGAHQIAGKANAVKGCENCHRPDTKLFKDVFIVVKKAEGKSTILNAKREVLNSVFSIAPVSKFYALGSTNIKLFDILFIVALIGGIAVPIGHASLRIITSPIRSLRRMGKGGKK